MVFSRYNGPLFICAFYGVLDDTATSLASPSRGHMDGRIEESMSSRLEIDLVEAGSGKSLFRGRGRNVALEVAGRVEEIITG